MTLKVLTEQQQSQAATHCGQANTGTSDHGKQRQHARHCCELCSSHAWSTLPLPCLAHVAVQPHSWRCCLPGSRVAEGQGQSATQPPELLAGQPEDTEHLTEVAQTEANASVLSRVGVRHSTSLTVEPCKPFKGNNNSSYACTIRAADLCSPSLRCLDLASVTAMCWLMANCCTGHTTAPPASAHLACTTLLVLVLLLPAVVSVFQDHQHLLSQIR